MDGIIPKTAKPLAVGTIKVSVRPYGGSAVGDVSYIQASSSCIIPLTENFGSLTSEMLVRRRAKGTVTPLPVLTVHPKGT